MKTILLSVFSATLFFMACGKDKGYVKVKNQTSTTLDNVNWGSSTDLGNISSGNSKDVETNKTGKEYIYFSISGTSYKSTEQLKVDANTGATLIVKDSTDYVEN